MKGSTLSDKAQDGRDLSKELAIVRMALESQSQATLQLADQVAALGAKAEQLSASNIWPASPDQLPAHLPTIMDLPSTEELPRVRFDAGLNDLESRAPTTASRSPTTPSRAPNTARHSLFQDTQALKEMIRCNLQDTPYNVTNYYKKSGVFQAIARNRNFELVSLALVIGSSVWMAVDLDFNNAVMLHQADIGFQVVANSVCFLFTAELTIRFLAFDNVRNIVKDFWCMFDLFLVVFMIVETWVLWCLAAALGFEVAGNNIRVLTILRMMRLVRIMRLVKLFRFMPELLVIIRGIGIALRAISLVFALLGLIVYIGAITFRVLFEDTAIGKKRFDTVTQAMGTLLLDCALSGTKGGPLMREAYQTHPFYSFLIFCFALLANVTIMGVLGGLLVQTIKKVAEVEEEEKRIFNNLATMDVFWSHLEEMDENNDGYISRVEFLNHLSQPQTLKILKQLDVDPELLVFLSDFMFEENKGRLSQEAFNQWVLDLRGSQKSTLKDHYVTRKFMMTKLTQFFKADPQASPEAPSRDTST